MVSKPQLGFNVSEDSQQEMNARWGQHCIYVLLCPETNTVRYVGYTRQVQSRKQDHTARIASVQRTAVQRWTKTLIEAGTPPKFVVVGKVETLRFDVGNSSAFDPRNEACAMEQRLIKRLRECGCDLLNEQ